MNVALDSELVILDRTAMGGGRHLMKESAVSVLADLKEEVGPQRENLH